MKHEVHQAIQHIKKLIAEGKDYNITQVASFFGIARESLSKALKREGITK